MSALGQKQTCAVHQPMSALPPKADKCSALAHVGLSAPKLPGSRLLEESYGANRFGMAVSKGQAAGRLAYMSEFIDEARASGLIQRIIDRSGLVGLQVVPVAKSN